MRFATKLEGGDAKSRMNRILATTARAAGYVANAPGISGDLSKWRPVTLDFCGPRANASGSDPNPFLDYRMTVEFAHQSGTPRYQVPGYFAADGQAANSSAR